MDKIFEHADDLHVRSTYVYGKTTSDNYVYADSDCTEKISADKLKDLFLKGVVIVIGTAFYKPTSFSISSGVGAVTFVKANTTTATTAVLTTLNSKEYTAS